MPSTFIAKTFYGLETILAREITKLGGIDVEPINRAVSFKGDLEVLYKVNLHARTALRVLKPILNISAHNEIVLYKRIQRFDWWKLFNLDQTFAIDSTVNSDIFRHSKFVALKTKDAIVDQFRDKYRGKRPSVDTQNPDIRIHIHCRNKDFTISLDSSGTSLHRRGYRTKDSLAPLNEALAAGMVLLSDWNEDQYLLDPMCGSGTILIEAAMIAQNIPPRISWRKFAFMKWPDFNHALWNRIQVDARRLQKSKKEIRLMGRDKNLFEIQDLKSVLFQFSFGKNILLEQSDFFHSEAPSSSGIIITNPPYGKRFDSSDIELFYKSIGDTLKNQYSGWEVWILSGNKEAIKRVGLKTSKKRTLYNGQIECKFHKYDLYQGKKS